MKKRTVKQHTLVSKTAAGIGAGLALLGALFGETAIAVIFLLLGVVIVAGSILYRRIFVRCPHCGDRWLDMRTTPDYCPRCGRYIE